MEKKARGPRKHTLEIDTTNGSFNRYKSILKIENNVMSSVQFIHNMWYSYQCAVATTYTLTMVVQEILRYLSHFKNWMIFNSASEIEPNQSLWIGNVNNAWTIFKEAWSALCCRLFFPVFVIFFFTVWFATPGGQNKMEEASYP